MRTLLDRACRHRYVVLSAVAVLMWVNALSDGGAQGQDWHYFLSGASAVTGSVGFHVYARMPYLQFGPIPLLLAIPLRHLGPEHGWYVVSALGMAAGVIAVAVAERTFVRLSGSSADRLQLQILIGGAFFLGAWSWAAVAEAHPDDVLALLSVMLSVNATTKNRWLLASVLIGLGAASKPWAIFALPLAAALPQARWRGPVVAVIAAGVPWIPFELVDHSTLQMVGTFHLPVETLSSLRALGLTPGAQPTWPREAQFAAAVILGGVAVWRGAWLLVPLIAFAVRINLDAASVEYYGIGAVMGAFLWDLAAPVRIPAMRTILVWFALFYLIDDIRFVGLPASFFRWLVTIVRLVVLLVPVWVATRAARDRALAPALVGAKPVRESLT